jgi:hypothetical protein
MKKQFKDLQVGNKFTKDSIEFVRIDDERVSCCKVFNSRNTSTNEKVMILPLDEVEVQE